MINFLKIGMLFLCLPMVGQRMVLLDDQDKKPIEQAEVYQRGAFENRFISNKAGEVVVTLKDSNELVLSHDSFETKIILTDALKDTIYLSRRKDINMVDEVVVVSMDAKTVEQEVSALITKHIAKVISRPLYYEIDGEHLVLEEQQDTLILIKSPFKADFNPYKKISMYNEVAVKIDENLIKRKKEVKLTLPYYSPIFLSSTLSKIKLENFACFSKFEKYIYTKYKSAQSVIYQFRPKQPMVFGYSGYLEVDTKGNVVHLYVGLEDNEKNVDKVTSLSKRHPSSKTDYEIEEIEIFFNENASVGELKAYYQLSQNSKLLNAQYEVNSAFKFKEISKFVADEETLVGYLYVYSTYQKH